jgi:hypothetical protein
MAKEWRDKIDGSSAWQVHRLYVDADTTEILGSVTLYDGEWSAWIGGRGAGKFLEEERAKQRVVKGVNNED